MAFDRTNPDDLLALKNEANNDPNGYGYDVADTNSILSNINLKRAGITVSKPKISSAAIRSLTTYEAFDGLQIPEQDWLRWITGSNGFEEETLIVTQDLRDRLTGALGGSQSGDSIWAASDDDAMEPIMLGLIDVEGSRAEELWGYGTTISKDDWRAARDS